MAAKLATNWLNERIPGTHIGLWVGHGVVLLLLLVHTNAMATGECAALMGPSHGVPVTRPGPQLPALAAHRPAPAQRLPAAPSVPVPAWVCPAQQAVLTLFAFALILLLAALGAGRQERIPAVVPAVQASGGPVRPPPLSARRRRALLQIFLN